MATKIKIYDIEGYQVPINEAILLQLLTLEKEEFKQRKNKFMMYNQVPTTHNYMLVQMSNKEENGQKRRTFYEVFVKPSDRETILSQSYAQAVEGDTEIFFSPKNIYELFSIILDRSDELVTVWTYEIFLNLLIEHTKKRSVISQKKDKVFTFLLTLSKEVATTITQDKISRPQARGIRRVLGQIVDPRNEWFGAKGYLLYVVHNTKDDKYSLVARRPKKSELKPDSNLVYIAVTPEPELSTVTHELDQLSVHT